MASVFGARKGVFKAAKDKQDRHAPKTARRIILTICAFLTACLWIGSTTNVPEVTRATGELVPMGGYRQVQSPEGGTVLQVSVIDGQAVTKGEALAVLGSSELTDAMLNTQEDLRSARTELSNLRRLLQSLTVDGLNDASVPTALQDAGFGFAAAQMMIISAEYKAQQSVAADLTATLAGLQDALALATKRLDTRQQQVDRQNNLFAQKLVTRQSLDAQIDGLDQIQATILDLKIRISQSQKDLTEAKAALERDILQRRTVLVADIFRLEQDVEALSVRSDALKTRSETLVIRAPESGFIHQVAYPNTGEVIAPGETIFEVLPADIDLIAEIEFDPIDIGHIAAGDEVTLKLETFDVRRYGHVEGRIESISPNSITDPQTSREYFRAHVALKADTIGTGRWTRKLQAGMVTTAEIVTAERTAIAYLAKPISRSLETAFGER